MLDGKGVNITGRSFAHYKKPGHITLKDF